MGCEWTVIRREGHHGACPPLPGIDGQVGRRVKPGGFVNKSVTCNKAALYYEVSGELSKTTMWLCEQHRHELASLGQYTLVLTMPPAEQPPAEPTGLPGSYLLPPERT